MKSRKFGRLTINTVAIHSPALLVAGDLLQQLVHAVHHVSHFRVLFPGLREGKDTDDGDWIGGSRRALNQPAKRKKARFQRWEAHP